jgi:hypothetical protein
VQLLQGKARVGFEVPQRVIQIEKYMTIGHSAKYGFSVMVGP